MDPQDVTDRFWSKVDKNGSVHDRLGTRCWLWTACTVKGYGQFRFAGQTKLAHRLSWEFVNGPIPATERYHDAEIMHDCDVPACVNPDHLRLGTHAENLTDMVRRGRHGSRTMPERVARGDRHMSRTKPWTVARGDRHGARARPEKLSRGDAHYSRTTPELLARGENNGNVKLTADKVREIRLKVAVGQRDSALGLEYCVHPDTIKQIRTWRTWRHVV